MKKSMIALGAVALCGSVLADVASANVVGYSTYSKTDGTKYEAYGCPFVTPGAAGASFRLYDLKVVGTLTVATKKSNFIQMFQRDTLKLDNVNSFFWDYNMTSAVTGEKGCWCYKNSDATTGQVANTEVPHDVTFPAGTAFFCNFPTDGKGIGLQFAGEVLKPTPDANGYITIAKPGQGTANEAKYVFVANPFPVEISLADLKMAGTLTVATKKSNFIQYFQKSTLKLDNVKSYFWDYNKASATGGTGCWCYKNSDATTGQAANAEVLDAASIKIKPGEGFFLNSPTTAKGICIMIKVPESIKSL